MDNSDEQLVSTDAVRAYLCRLHGAAELPPHATTGECMECERDRQPLWIIGDFLLCVRCALRRRRVAAQLAAASPP